MKIFLKILKWLGIILAALIVLLFLLTSFVINRYKTQTEQAISRQTGIEARIEGNLQLKILPGFSLVVNKLDLVSNETYFLRAESAEFAIDLQSLVFGPNTLVTSIQLKKPQVFIFKTDKNNFNFEPEKDVLHKNAKPVHFNLNKIAIEGGKLLYFDTKQKDTLILEGISLNTIQIRADGNFEKFSLKNTYFEGILQVEYLQLNAMQIRNLQFKVVENSEQVLVTPAIDEFYGGKLSGKTTIDLSLQPVRTGISLVASGVKIDSLLMDFETALYLGGKVDLQADLNFDGFDWDELRESMQGNLVLAGNNVTIYGFDTETVLANYYLTGDFGAVNAGAALSAGPFGAIFLNNMAMTKLLTNNSGDSSIAEQFVSNWKFVNGTAIAEDVAFSDGTYRLAVSGSINCVEKSYQNFSISLLNRSGCTVLSQELNGDFQTAIPITISSVDNKNDLQIKVREAVSSRNTCPTPYSGTIADGK